VEGRRIGRVLVEENLKERNPLGKPRRTWEDNIKLDLKEIRSMV
jgi:hypothetical protein